MINKSILILTGGSICRDFAKDFLNRHKFDIVIAVDSGLVTACDLNIPVDYLVGDFDSVPKELLDKFKDENKSVIIKQFNPMKDETDTQIAINLAIELQTEQLVILGAIGTRVDHLLANIHLLCLPLAKKINAFIINEHNKIYLINKNTTLFKNQLFGTFISFLPLTECVTGVTLEGFKYPLTEKKLVIGDSIGVSNEVTDSKADVWLQDGILIAIESKD